MRDPLVSAATAVVGAAASAQRPNSAQTAPKQPREALCRRTHRLHVRPPRPFLRAVCPGAVLCTLCGAAVTGQGCGRCAGAGFRCVRGCLQCVCGCVVCTAVHPLGTVLCAAVLSSPPHVSCTQFCRCSLCAFCTFTTSLRDVGLRRNTLPHLYPSTPLTAFPRRRDVRMCACAC